MIVWGGCAGSIDCWPTTSTGGKYDPGSDAWSATNLFNAPERRLWHSGIWTGEALIVWGGLSDQNGYTKSGGVYYPGQSENTAPVAVDDSYFASQFEILSVPAPGVLGNDTDPDGDPITAALVSGTVHGALWWNGNGAFSYEPFPGFTGPDTFTYRVTDGQADSNLATVTIVVDETANTVPTAEDDDFSTAQQVSLVVSAPGLLDNDSDPDGDPLTAVLQTTPANGSVTVNPDGSFSYTPENGFTGVDTFTYRAEDGRGGTDTATVTITVIGDPGSEWQIFIPVVIREE
jgi:VCBS repeat-containing protein